MTSVSRLFYLCLVLVSTGSTLGSFPYPYPQFQPSLPLTTHLIYNVPIDGRAADFAGFSYFTKDLGGGESEVVFVTGPNSDAQMNEEVAAMRGQLDSMTPIPESATGAPDSGKNNPEDSKEEKNPGDSTPVTLVTGKAEETSISATKNEGKDDDAQGVSNGQLIPGQAFGLRAPYPILRLSGSTSYYPQSTGGFPGYEPFDYFKSKFDPFYGHYGSYQTLYHPFYSAIDDYYNRLSPLSYSGPIFAPTVGNFVPGDSLPATNSELQGAQEVKLRLGAEEAGKISPQKSGTDNVENFAASESPITDGADAEKKPALSTTTEKLPEQFSESSTPVSQPVVAISSEETLTDAASSTETSTVAVEVA